MTTASSPPSSPSSSFDELLPVAPPTSLFPLLPTELVESIIESSVPYYFHSKTYQSRQSTLCSLSLVCRLFHDIAKPLLFAVVKWNTKKRYVAVLDPKEEEDPNRKLCRELVLWVGKDISVCLGALRAHFGVTSLVLKVEEIDLVELSSMKSELDVIFGSYRY